MCYTEKTGSKGNNESLYAIHDLNKLQIQMIEEGLKMLRETLVKAENNERYKLVIQLDKLNNSLKNLEI